jgi:hypothetical protein
MPMALPSGPASKSPPGVGGEHLEQAVQVAARAGGDELLGDLPVLGDADVEGSAAPAVLDLLPGPAGQLAAGRRRPADGLRDRLERHAEDVMQDEHHPLGRAEPLQHDQESELDVVVQRHPVGRIARKAGGRLAAGNELDHAGIVRPLTPGAGGADLIQA